MTTGRIATAIFAALFLTITITFTSPDSAESANDARFAVIGDFGSERPGEKAVADLIDQWNVDFITTVGDNVYSGDSADPLLALDKKVGRYYHEYIGGYKGRYGSGAPGENKFFPALGNHDWGDPGAALLDCSGGCSGAWNDFFQLPGNERYYEVRKGPVHLFVVDDYYLEPDGNKPDSVQGRWLKNGLENSDAEFKVVSHHYPAYASGGGNPRMRWPFKEWGADAVFSGHIHNYERLDIDGLPYFVNGLGGTSKSGFGPTPHPQSKKRYLDEYGAMLVDVNRSTMTLKFINTKGAVIDSITVNSNGKQAAKPAAPAAPKQTTTTAPPATQPPTTQPPSNKTPITNPPAAAPPKAAPTTQTTAASKPATQPNKLDATGLDFARYPNSPRTSVSANDTGKSASGNFVARGTAQYSEGVKWIDLVVRNLDTGRYWNSSTSTWQKKFYTSKVKPSEVGGQSISWGYTIDKSHMQAGSYKVRAWARGPRGNGDPFGNAQVETSWP